MGKWYEDEQEEELEYRGGSRRRPTSAFARGGFRAASPGRFGHGSALHPAHAGTARSQRTLRGGARASGTGRWDWLARPATISRRHPSSNIARGFQPALGSYWSGAPFQQTMTRHRRHAHPPPAAGGRWGWLAPWSSWSGGWPYGIAPGFAPAQPDPIDPASPPPSMFEPAAPPPDVEPSATEPVSDDGQQGAPEPASDSGEPGSDGAATGVEAPAEELELEYRAKLGSVSTGITRWQRCELTDFALTGIPSGGGVYIVCTVEGSQERPVYVGEADDFRVRWHKRLLEAYQLGLIARGPLPSRIVAYFGSMPRVSHVVRRAVETILVRVLLLSGVHARAGLRNRKQFKPIELTGGIQISNALPTDWAKQVGPGATARLQHARTAAQTANQRRQVISLEVLLRGWTNNALVLPPTIAGTVFELAVG